MADNKFLSNNTTIKLVVQLLILFLNRLILIVSIPFILFNVVCALIVIIKNWSLKHTQELNV
jgi:hypothetical protein